jgi:subtilisin family serine protease
MTKFNFLFAIFFAVGVPVFPSISHAQVSPPLVQKAPDAAEMADIALKKGYVRIIAEFTGPVPAGQLRPDPAQLAPVKERIASMQGAIIASHFGSATNPRSGQGFQRSLVLFDITPMFAVNVTKTELEALAADARIVHIQLVRLVPPNLLQSVPLIGMPNAYALGATGAGQAVAIIDTGVQANHEFLAGKVVMEACFSNPAGVAGRVSLCPNGQPSQTGAGAADPTTAQCLNGVGNICTHGTHVAGIAAGSNTKPGGGKPNNGGARGADIVAVQVFQRVNSDIECKQASPKFTAPCVLSSDEDQMMALNWIYANALTPAVGVHLAAVNMSLGGGNFTTPCDDKMQKKVHR